MFGPKAIIAWRNQPVGIKNPQIVLGLRHAPFSGFAIPIPGAGEINWEAGRFK